MTLRACLAEPIEAIFVAAEKLTAAADAHLVGDKRATRALLMAANDQLVWEFTDRMWGKGATAMLGLKLDPNGPAQLPLNERSKPRMPLQSVRQAVLERDGRHCRFCGIPVISRTIRSILHRAYPDALPWGTATTSQHAAFQCMWLQFDHILPNSRGGASSVDNVVVTCAPCNFSRMQFTLAEAGLVDPLSHPTPQRWVGYSAWDGLERLMNF